MRRLWLPLRSLWKPQTGKKEKKKKRTGNTKTVSLQSRIIWFVAVTNTLSITFGKAIVFDELSVNTPATYVLNGKESHFSHLADSSEKIYIFS